MGHVDSSVKVNFNPQEIYSKIQKSTDVALWEMGLVIMQDTDRLVPMNSGLLRSSASLDKLSKNNINISYSRPLGDYGDIANDVYRGFNPETNRPIYRLTTPGTTIRWFDASKNENLDFWIDYFKERTREIWRNRPSKNK